MTTIDPSTVPDKLAERDLEQIQALVFRGWATEFKFAAMLFVRLPRDISPDQAWDSTRAKAWLKAVKEDIAWFRGTTATQLPADGGRKLPGRRGRRWWPG